MRLLPPVVVGPVIMVIGNLELIIENEGASDLLKNNAMPFRVAVR